MPHLARLQIDMHAFLHLMQAGLFEVVRWPVPADATLMQVTYDSQRHVFWAIFAHDSFPVVQPGAILPKLEAPLITSRGGQG